MTRLLLPLLVLFACFSLMGTDCDKGMTQIDPPTALSDISVSATAVADHFCCDPEDLPQAVGTITIENNSTGEEPIYFNAGASSDIVLDPASGTVAEGETVTISVSVTNCDFRSVSVDLNYGFDPTVYPVVDHPALHGSQTITINNACRSIYELAGWLCPGDADFLNLVGWAWAFNPVGVETLHSSILIAAAIPFLDFTMIRGMIALQKNFDQQQVDLLYGRGDFPCGTGPNAFTVCPNIPLQPTGGDFFLVWNSLDAEVPLTDAEHQFQYGFVFDADGDTGNNYQGSGDYANDFYDDTDRWYSVEKTIGGAWTLKVTDARTGSGFQEIASAARVIIHEDAMLLMVPASEFADATPRYRVTAFAHHGDYGLNDPFYWSGDLAPPVAEGLATLTAGTE